MRIVLRLLLLAGVSACLVACDQETEGCLDFRALEVDVDADNACDDCCSYPSLRLQFVPAQLLPDTTIRLTRATTLALAPDDTFRLIEFSFYISDIALELVDGSQLALSDTVSFRQNTSANFQREDVSLLQYDLFGSSTQNLGELLEEQEVTGLSFHVGLPEVLASADPLAQQAGSRLAPAADSLLVSDDRSTLLAGRVVYARPLTDTLPAVTILPEASQRILLAFDGPVDLPRSFNLTVSVAIDAVEITQATAEPLTADEFVDLCFANARVQTIIVAR